MRTRTLALVAAVAATASVGRAQVARAEEPILDEISIKLDAAFPLPQDAHQDVLATTGHGPLDARLRAMGVEEIRRIFREPPRGWRDPVAARDAGLDRWITVSWSEDQRDLDPRVQQLNQHQGVELAKRIVRAFVADTVPDDPMQGSQYAWANHKIRAYKAWDIATDSTVLTAVIDSGTDLDHADLVANSWTNPGEIAGNGLDDDNNGYIDDIRGWDFYYDDPHPDDVFGHGVHCQGTVGAVSNNGHQVAGVCWNATVMPVKILSDSGSGDAPRSAAGMVYAADNGARVTSMSWGFNAPQAEIEAAVDYSHSLDVLQIAAAHNFGSTSKVYPAAYGKVMGIIATDERDNRTSWSNYGHWCSMAAPGNNILSTYLDDGTATLSGTSMSTPHVAGAAALVRTLNPLMDKIDARLCLEQSSKDLGDAGFDVDFGWGRLDLYAALVRAGALKASATKIAPGASVNVELCFPGEGGFLHFLLPSTFNRRPGFDLQTFTAGDFRRVPLNYDSFFFSYVLNHPDDSGFFDNFVGNLDASGKTTSTLHTPTGNLFSGRSFSLSAVTIDPSDASRVQSVSGSSRVRIQ